MVQGGHAGVGDGHIQGRNSGNYSDHRVTQRPRRPCIVTDLGETSAGLLQCFDLAAHSILNFPTL